MEKKRLELEEKNKNVKISIPELKEEVSMSENLFDEKPITTEVSLNPYKKDDIKYLCWEQNLQEAGETRGFVGYVKISSVNRDYKNWILFQSNDNFSSYLGDKNRMPMHGIAGINWHDNNVALDEHIYKISYNGSSRKITNSETKASIVAYYDSNARYMININN